MTRRQVGVHLLHGAGQSDVTVLLVHVVRAGARIITQPETEVLDVVRVLESETAASNTSKQKRVSGPLRSSQRPPARASAAKSPLLTFSKICTAAMSRGIQQQRWGSSGAGAAAAAEKQAQRNARARGGVEEGVSAHRERDTRERCTACSVMRNALLVAV